MHYIVHVIAYILFEFYFILSPSSAGFALSALAWSSIVMNICFGSEDKMTGDSFKRMVELQCMFCFGAYATERNSIKQGAYNRLKRTWIEVCISIKQMYYTVHSTYSVFYYGTLGSCYMYNARYTIRYSEGSL